MNLHDDTLSSVTNHSEREQPRATAPLEQLGFRKIVDTTFMMASLITRDLDMDDVRKYFRALRKAQRDIDLRPDLYTHYYKKEFPTRFHDVMDTRRWVLASAWSSSPIPRMCSRNPSSGSPNTAFFPKV
jgi:hypothetical protein